MVQDKHRDDYGGGAGSLEMVHAGSAALAGFGPWRVVPRSKAGYRKQLVLDELAALAH